MSEVSHSTDGSEKPTHEIPIDQMPSILETVAPPPEHQYQHPDSLPQRNNKLRLAVAGGLLAVGVGIGALVAGGGAEERRLEQTATDTPDATPETTPTTADTVATTEVTTPPTTEETLPPEFAIEPVLMTATTPEGLMDEFIDNIHCMFGAYPMELQNKCLQYMTADQEGNLTDGYRSRIIAMNGYREDNPGFDFFFNANIVEYEMGENTARIVADVEDAAGTSRQLYTFRKFPLTIEGSGLNDTESGGTVWGLTEEDTLNPGEVSFG